jgi:tRNA wybutosine-synthesizing protein 3
MVALSSTTNRHGEFVARKAKIMTAIDKSPKGSFDAPILDMLAMINRHPNYVTTSSCSGRISLFRNNAISNAARAGGKEEEKEEEKEAPGETAENNITAENINTDDPPDADIHERSSPGSTQGNAKGDSSANNAAANSKGGVWVYVNHECENKEEVKLDVRKAVFGSENTSSDGIRGPDGATAAPTHYHSGQQLKLIFEGLLLHIEACDLEAGRKMLALAQQAGYRESGLCVTEKRVLIHIRTNAFTMQVPFLAEHMHG